MRGPLVNRRVQFSSCDECRKSRVGCDALTRRDEAEEKDKEDNGSPACSRCLRRNRDCTFTWIRDAKANGTFTKKPARRRRAHAPEVSESFSPDVPEPGRRDARPELSLADILDPDPVPNGETTRRERDLTEGGLLTDAEADWLPSVYAEGFEAVFGSWMGRYSNPFAFDQDFADKYISISQLCAQLDRWMADSLPDGHSSTSQPKDETSQYLSRTIAAYSARWLPISTGVIEPVSPRHQATAVALWRRARRDMLKVINRPSYRSMLALFLFALTPIPTGISEDEEADGISGQACVHAALQQIQTLRARQRILQFNGSKVSSSTLASTAPSPTSPRSSSIIGTPGFINAESTAYWAALTFDTSASLTLNCRPLLSSGLFGFEAELPWRLIRTCAQMFKESSKQWAQSSLDMTDERANQIVAAGAAWKLLAWKLTAIFKEALRDGHDEAEVRKAYLAVVESIKQFNAVYRQHLEACQRRMAFLSQQTKLRWYSLMLHYHLSILMLVDIIEVTNRIDLLVDIAEANTDAESAVMNTLAFGLHNTFTLNIPASGSSTDGETTVTVPLVSVDPYPHHIVAGSQLVRKTIDRNFNMGKIAQESYDSLLSTLERTLSYLPQSSKSVKAARVRFSSLKCEGPEAMEYDPFAALQLQLNR